MNFNDTAPVLPRPNGPPPWLSKLTEDATLEGAVLKRAVHGRDTITALIKAAIRSISFRISPATMQWENPSSWNRIARRFKVFLFKPLSGFT